MSTQALEWKPIKSFSALVCLLVKMSNECLITVQAPTSSHWSIETSPLIDALKQAFLLALSNKPSYWRFETSILIGVLKRLLIDASKQAFLLVH